MKKLSNNRGLLPALAALLLSSLLAACGGGGGGQEPILGGLAVSATPAAPTVTAVSPQPNATAVPRNVKALTASFSRAMIPTTLSASSFTLGCLSGPAITGSVSYVPSTRTATLTLLPTAPNLPASTSCTATITTAAQADNGQTLAAPFIWSFRTSAAADTTAPTVTSTINANGATGVPTNTKVGATFSEAMNAASVAGTNFLLKESVSNAPVAGSLVLTGANAVFTPTANLKPTTAYTVTIHGGSGGVTDLAGNVLGADYVWNWTTAATSDTTAPTVTRVNPADAATNVATSSAVNATFSESMDPTTLTNASFTVQGVSGTVSTSSANTIATFTPAAALTANTTYTATIDTTASDLAGNSLAASKVWTFTTAAVPVVAPTVDLATAAPFGTFGGTAGMTNTGTLTVVNGDIGTIATATGSITGFHDTNGDIYTETPANIGAVNGTIYTCTNSTTGPNLAGANAPNCAIATQARLDAQTAYLALVAKAPLGGSPAPGQNLAGLTLLPGVYNSASGDFMIQGGDLTLDAQGDANATWVFQMSTTLTVGGPGAAFPQSIILAGGAQAKNVFWQVGSFATINAGGGGTMVGTIISQTGAAFSTAGNVTPVILQGRVLSLGASVTLVNTVITVPAP